MAARVTQIAGEAVITPDDPRKVRVTQVAVEAIIAPDDPRYARATQVVIEAVVSRVYADPCENPWTIPTPDPYPTPGEGGPQYLYFEEIEPEYRSYLQEFPDLHVDANITAGKIRHFVFEYDGLSAADAQILDDHYALAKTAFSFQLTVPRTGEVITGVRYDSQDGFKIPNHKKVWVRSRSVRLVKYP